MPDAPKGTSIPTNLDDFLLSHSERGKVLGSWGFDPRVNFTKMKPEESNVWFFEQVFNFLRAFFGVIMPDSLEITIYNAKRQITREKLDQMTFLDELMLIMKNLKEPIWVLKLNLSIVGFLHTDWHLSERPIRVRIQEPTNFIIWGGPDESGFQSFSIGYSLFSTQKIEGKGVELWSVNQPLLEKALKKWEKQSGRRIGVVQGNSDQLSLYPHGFKKPAPSGIAPTPPRRPPPIKEEPPKEDFIPNFEDLNT